MDTKIHLCYSNDVFLAVGNYPGDIFLLPVNLSHLTAVDVVLWCGDTQRAGQQIERDKAFELAEFPEIHRVDVLYFPRLLARNVQYGGNGNAVDDHTTAEI